MRQIGAFDVYGLCVQPQPIHVKLAPRPRHPFLLPHLLPLAGRAGRPFAHCALDHILHGKGHAFAALRLHLVIPSLQFLPHKRRALDVVTPAACPAVLRRAGIAGIMKGSGQYLTLRRTAPVLSSRAGGGT